MQKPIQIPEDAPFSPEQRVWLHDFLTRTLGPGAVEDSCTWPAVPVTILFGTQTGNAEGCAKKVAKGMKGGRFAPEVVDLSDYDTSRLAGEQHLLVITSTYGDGEPPDGAADFHEWLMSDAAPRLEGVKYSVLGLGDTEYPDFCQCAIDFDERLAALGAERIHARVDCDVEYDEPFAAWRQGVMAVLAPAAAAEVAVDEAEEEAGYSKTRPFPATVLENYNLNKEGSGRETHHIALSLEGSGLEYEVGDALGVVPHNDPAMVAEILAALPFNIKEEVPLPGGGEAPLCEALMHAYDIRSLTPKMVEKWQERSGSPYLRSLIEATDKEPLQKFCWGRELIDLVIEHPGDFGDAEDFVGVLKKLQPRLYSIASSPKAHPGEVHLTIAIVRYQAHHRDRGGVCSTFLADRSVGLEPGVFVHVNKAFRMTSDGDQPIIMVGPGTGIAPFRAYLEEREATGAKGRNWLFFGNPHRATDFIYEQELRGFQDRGVLTRLDTAFSRDQEHKIYVQDRMLEAGAELWRWLQDGAAFYVCGDASRMAKDVDRALHTIVQEHGGISEEAAVEYIKTLRKEKRYSRDVY